MRAVAFCSFMLSSARSRSRKSRCHRHQPINQPLIFYTTLDILPFQWWALSLIRAKPLGGQEGSKTGKKGSDKGIDGVINFIDDGTGKPKRVVVQVKSGHVKSGDIRDLIGTMGDTAEMGVFITLEAPSRDMLTAAVSAGFY